MTARHRHEGARLWMMAGGMVAAVAANSAFAMPATQSGAQAGTLAGAQVGTRTGGETTEARRVADAAADAAAAAEAIAMADAGDDAGRGVSFVAPPVRDVPAPAILVTEETIVTAAATDADADAGEQRIARMIVDQPTPVAARTAMMASGQGRGQPVVTYQPVPQPYPQPYPQPVTGGYPVPQPGYYPAPYPMPHGDQGADPAWGQERWPGRDADLDRRCGHGGRTLGAVAGGVVGGIVGNRVAGRGDRTVGTVIGALGGAAVGGAFGDASDRDRCAAYAERYASWRRGAHPQGHGYGHGYGNGIAYQGGAMPYGYYTPGYVVTTIIEDAGDGGDVVEEVTTTTYEDVPVQVRRPAPRKVYRAKPRPKPRAQPRCVCR